MEISGIEPLTPLLARQVLSQLSYIPFLNIFLHNSALIALFLSHLHLGKLLAELRQAALTPCGTAASRLDLYKNLI